MTRRIVLDLDLELVTTPAETVGGREVPERSVALGRVSCEVGPRLGFADMIEGSGSGLSAGDREAMIKVFSKPKPIPVRIVEECGAAWRGPYYLTTFATTQQTDAGYTFEFLLEAAGKLERETGE